MGLFSFGSSSQEPLTENNVVQQAQTNKRLADEVNRLYKAVTDFERNQGEMLEPLTKLRTSVITATGLMNKASRDGDLSREHRQLLYHHLKTASIISNDFQNGRLTADPSTRGTFPQVMRQAGFVPSRSQLGSLYPNNGEPSQANAGFNSVPPPQFNQDFMRGPSSDGIRNLNNYFLHNRTKDNFDPQVADAMWRRVHPTLRAMQPAANQYDRNVDIYSGYLKGRGEELPTPMMQSQLAARQFSSLVGQGPNLDISGQRQLLSSYSTWSSMGAAYAPRMYHNPDFRTYLEKQGLGGAGYGTTPLNNLSGAEARAAATMEALRQRTGGDPLDSLGDSISRAEAAREAAERSNREGRFSEWFRKARTHRYQGGWISDPSGIDEHAGEATGLGMRSLAFGMLGPMAPFAAIAEHMVHTVTGHDSHSLGRLGSRLVRTGMALPFRGMKLGAKYGWRGAKAGVRGSWRAAKWTGRTALLGGAATAGGAMSLISSGFHGSDHTEPPDDFAADQHDPETEGEEPGKRDSLFSRMRRHGKKMWGGLTSMLHFGKDTGGGVGSGDSINQQYGSYARNALGIESPLTKVFTSVSHTLTQWKNKAFKEELDAHSPFQQNMKEQTKYLKAIKNALMGGEASGDSEGHHKKGGFFGGLLKDITAGISKFGAWALGGFGLYEIFKNLKGLAGSVLESIGKLATGLISGLRSAAVGAWNWMKGLFHGGGATPDADPTIKPTDPDDPDDPDATVKPTPKPDDPVDADADADPVAADATDAADDAGAAATDGGSILMPIATTGLAALPLLAHSTAAHTGRKYTTMQEAMMLEKGKQKPKSKSAPTVLQAMANQNLSTNLQNLGVSSPTLTHVGATAHPVIKTSSSSAFSGAAIMSGMGSTTRTSSTAGGSTPKDAKTFAVNSAFAKEWKQVPSVVKQALSHAAKVTGVSLPVLTAVSKQESSWNPHAANISPDNDAVGLFQFEPPTWLGMIRKYGSSIGIDVENMADSALLALRENPLVNAVMGGFLLKSNGKALGSTDPGVEYLGNYLGPTDAKKVLDNLSKPLGSLLPTSFFANNPNLSRNEKGSTLLDWAQSVATGGHMSGAVYHPSSSGLGGDLSVAQHTASSAASAVGSAAKSTAHAISFGLGDLFSLNKASTTALHSLATLSPNAADRVVIHNTQMRAAAMHLPPSVGTIKPNAISQQGVFELQRQKQAILNAPAKPSVENTTKCPPQQPPVSVANASAIPLYVSDSSIMTMDLGGMLT